MKEIWKPIQDYPEYFISSKGRVKKGRTTMIIKKRLKARFLKPFKSNGYQAVWLGSRKAKTFKMIRVHRLMAKAFILNPLSKNQINHIDGNKMNNLLENLEWSTALENVRHSLRMQLRRSRLTIENVKKIREEGMYNTYKDIAIKYKISKELVRRIIKKINWGWV